MITDVQLKFLASTLSGENAQLLVKLDLKIENENGIYLIHRALIKQLIEHRQGNAHTKTRSEVRGGGKKPWKQKGTGRARAGSTRSPLWKGGGVTFGPRKKKYEIKLNKKEWRLSLQTLLFNKRKSIKIIDRLASSFENIQKTKTVLYYLNKLSLLDSNGKPKNILIIVAYKPKNLIYSTQNLKNVNVILANNLNIKSLLDADYILIDFIALKTIQETYARL